MKYSNLLRYWNSGFLLNMRKRKNSPTSSMAWGWGHIQKILIFAGIAWKQGRREEKRRAGLGGRGPLEAQRWCQPIKLISQVPLTKPLASKRAGSISFHSFFHSSLQAVCTWDLLKAPDKQAWRRAAGGAALSGPQQPRRKRRWYKTAAVSS